MLRHLTRVQKHTDLLKQCSAVQFVNSFRRESSDSKGNNDTKKYKEFVDITSPQERFLKNMKRDWKMLKHVLSNRQYSDFKELWERPQVIPSTCDVLIIGGGAIGSSIAYWLKQKIYREEFNVVVVEKDPTYYFSIPRLPRLFRWVVYVNNFLLKKIFTCHYMARNFCEILMSI